MAHVSNNLHLPCDGDGECMVCKVKPPPETTLTCNTCVTPWHVDCLSVKPETMAAAADWKCPDCNGDADAAKPALGSLQNSQSGQLIAAIRAIEADASLTDHEKAKRRQNLLGGASGQSSGEADGDSGGRNGVLDLLDKELYCSICMQELDRPVSTPCGHNFCLKCFQKSVGQQKHDCPYCRQPIPLKMAREPRINSALVIAIRTANLLRSGASGGPSKAIQFIHNQNRPDKAFTTERAKKAGKANACSGKIFVSIPLDHFGPIPPKNDPERKQGVLVGETWEDRMECRQWGAHFPHVAGISGQSDYGAQSVALSGGYEDDEDHGEWFLYTGSGGRDLSGNKRTNKEQSFDQKFDKQNEALRVSCLKGYPVRVVRSHKEKRSSYAPEKGVRYDGVYRIEKCWRKVGMQGFLVCRYLFVRCDNEPAPWTSDTHGDIPGDHPLPVIKELKGAKDVTERKETPAWDYAKEKGWFWKKPPPESRIQVVGANDGTRRVKRSKTLSVKEKLLKDFSCLTCRNVMVQPVSTPCAHNFCKGCLLGAFAGQSFTRQRTCEGRRNLREQKNIFKCPSCKHDITDFLQNPQVNREFMNIIESLQREVEKEDLESQLETKTEDAADSGSELKDEVDDNDENSDMLAGDKENCDMNSGSPEDVEDKKGDLEKPLTNDKSQKRKRASDSVGDSDAGVKNPSEIAEDTVADDVCSLPTSAPQV